MAGETFRIYCRGSDNKFQIRSFRQKLFEIPQKKVDIQAAFMSFINDDRIILFQKTVALRFGQKNAIRHQFDRCLGTQFVREADFVTDNFTDR